MTLVKIDKSTIRKNPDAGQTTFVRTMGPTVWYLTLCSYTEPDLPDWELLSEYSVGPGTIREYCRYSEFDVTSFTESLKDFTSANLRSETPTERINLGYSLPEWLYEYEPTEVQCEFCEATFLHTELNEEWDEWEDGYSHSQEVCPKCGVWDCCELKYERFK